MSRRGSPCTPARPKVMGLGCRNAGDTKLFYSRVAHKRVLRIRANFQSPEHRLSPRPAAAPRPDLNRRERVNRLGHPAITRLASRVPPRPPLVKHTLKN